MKLVLLLAFLLPISLLFWFATYFITYMNDEASVISPLRVLFAIVAPSLVARWGLERKSLDKSGALAGYLVGFILTLSNLCFFTALLAFFVLGSKVTKFRSQKKKRLEVGFKEGGQRNWVQVLCNGGVAAQFAVMYLIDVGCGEKLIDFDQHYNMSWLSMAVLGSLCCCCGDTFASEIGTVIGTTSTVRLITNLQVVPRGTNGGISVAGTIASLIGGLLVGVAYYITLLLLSNENYVISSPPQWPLVPLGGLFGVIGSIIDSYLGATLQYSGYDVKHRCIVERPGEGVQHISGSEVLDNHSVNFLSSLLTAFVAPMVSFQIWLMLI